MSKTKKEPDGSVPEHVINQVNEHTVGGFVLFYFNNLTGEPEQVMTFDSPAHSLGLQKYISDWTDAVNEINHDNSVLSIQQSVIDSHRRDEDGDENED